MKKLRRQLSAGFALIVLVAVFLVSLVSNLCISRQFEQYIARQQKSTSDDLAAGVALQYDAESGTWNVKTTQITKEISEGNYGMRFVSQSRTRELNALAQAAAASFDAEIAAKGLRRDVTGTASAVPGDERRLYQAITNLLSNAVKYTGDGGHIRLKVDDAPDCGILTVGDDGIGIPETDQTLVFERFYRTDRSRSRKTGGVGIGLTIAKAIVKAHGGKISLESREGESNRFTISLPKQQ